MRKKWSRPIEGTDLKDTVSITDIQISLDGKPVSKKKVQWITTWILALLLANPHW